MRGGHRSGLCRAVGVGPWVAAAVLLAAATAFGADPFVPNDTYYASHQWYGPLLNLPQAWAYSRGSADVIVAILDTGVMSNTPDLGGRLLDPLAAGSLPLLDGTVNHHGSWVASVAGMEINNGAGGAGMGNFSLLPITVTSASGGNTSENIAAGILLAAAHGARVVNISHGTLNYSALDRAVTEARTTLHADLLVFVAGGNSNGPRTITDFPNLVFVAGTNALDQRWEEGGYGSSWGAYMDLAAPADNILVADPDLPNGYGTIDGTSFAAPMAAGAAALAWSINPNLTADQVLAILCETAVDLGAPGRDPYFGYGRIDVGAVAARAYASVPEPATLGLLALGLAAGWRGLRRGR